MRSTVFYRSRKRTCNLFLKPRSRHGADFMTFRHFSPQFIWPWVLFKSNKSNSHLKTLVRASSFFRRNIVHRKLYPGEQPLTLPGSWRTTFSISLQAIRVVWTLEPYQLQENVMGFMSILRYETNTSFYFFSKTLELRLIHFCSKSYFQRQEREVKILSSCFSNSA